MRGVFLFSAVWAMCGAAAVLAQSAHTQTSGQSESPQSVVLEGTDSHLPPGERYRVEPQRVEQGPQVDGRLDEEVWVTAAVIEDFVQQEPAEGEPATERTVVRVLYDEQALYVGVEAFDSVPDKVIATEMRRDSPRLLDEDNFQIILDTFHDRRSGYMFVTSPLGAKLEQQVAEEGEGGFRGNNSSNINVNWDGVWDVVARRTDEGWVAEIRIPMVTLRFPKADQQVWGVNFMRNIRRKNEQVFWAPISKEYSLTRVSQAGTMTGITSVSRGTDLRITPYLLTGANQDRVSTRLDGSGFGDLGLDVKYGVTSGLNMDLTVNTDFAQVEVDEQQVNLTRFPLFFPEKRDFFLENAGMFQVGAGSGGFGRLADLFFTRRIGLSDAGQPIPIYGGARLSGKAGRHNIAVLNITTQSAFGNHGDNFFVGRYSRDILALQDRRDRHQQGVGRRITLQPHVCGRHDPCAAFQLCRQRLPGQDRDTRRLDRPERRLCPGYVAKPFLPLLRRVYRPPGQLQRRGWVRPTRRDSHIKVSR